MASARSNHAELPGGIALLKKAVTGAFNRRVQAHQPDVTVRLSLKFTQYLVAFINRLIGYASECRDLPLTGTVRYDRMMRAKIQGSEEPDTDGKDAARKQPELQYSKTDAFHAYHAFPFI